MSVWTPNRLVTINTFDANNDVGVFWDEELGDQFVLHVDGGSDGEHDVLSCSVKGLGQKE